MTAEADVRDEVRRFYDSVGWRQVGPGVFQNARYEDLRPVSREYIQRCRRRVLRHLPPRGRYLLDAGSGPIQYPEYLEYSSGYRYRVCVDLSILALQEARQRIGSHGLYIIADIANLPLPSDLMEGAVSLHTIHHLPAAGQRKALEELARVLVPGGQAVAVYGWGATAPIEALTRLPVRWASAAVRWYARLRGRGMPNGPEPAGSENPPSQGTHVFKHEFAWLMANTRHLPDIEVRVWRSVSTNFLRAFIHGPLLGRWWLRLLYWLEERAPHWFGRVGQYPLIVIRKPSARKG